LIAAKNAEKTIEKTEILRSEKPSTNINTKMASGLDRDDLVYMAKLAEQAER
jgi:hypothetical protein